jgi:two-component system, NarL family, nitrate/nitrite response regulator NarL
MIRVLIVNQVSLTCDMFATVLSEQPDIEVVGYSTNIAGALAKIDRCDVVVASTNLPEDGAIELTRAIVRLEKSARVLIVGLSESRADIVRCIEAGAQGYVHREDSVDELIRNIRSIYKGEALVTPDIAAALMNRLAELAASIEVVRPASVETAKLTPREREVLRLIGRNYTNQDIANHLIIEVGTVKNHVHNILSKLKVNSRREAANYLPIIKERMPWAQGSTERYLT